MGKIIILDEVTANQIAAGEVVERPASVVKELCENSIDADATAISVDIRQGGIRYIRVSDNGSGVAADDMLIAFERHATSKIRSSSDLDHIGTMGFRGEALASIASVAKVELQTRQTDADTGYKVLVEGGQAGELLPAGCPAGTVLTVRDLFYNTPARFKFLKKDGTEAGYIADILERLALGYPHIAFRLTSNGETLLHTPGNRDLLSAVYAVYGRDVAGRLRDARYEADGVRVDGLVGLSEAARANRNGQSFFINHRYVRSKLLTAAVEEAYKTRLMKGRFPFVILNLSLHPGLVDVNVHPTKMEVRFSDENAVFRAVLQAVSLALEGREISSPKSQTPVFSFREISPPDTEQGRLTPATKPVLHNGHHREETKELLKRDDKFSETKILPRPGVPEIAKPQTGIFTAPVLEKAEEKAASFIVSEEPAASVAVQPYGKTGAPLAAEHVPEEETPATASSESVYHHGFWESLSQSVYIGQAFSTYLLWQMENTLWLVDQHAAHERALFESLLRAHRKGQLLRQSLLVAEVIGMTASELADADTAMPFLDSLGFDTERFGKSELVVRTVPSGFEGDISAIVRDLWTLSSEKKLTLSGKTEEGLYQVACKRAIKANQRVSEQEARALLQSMVSLENPFSCPHGRPTVISMTQHELEKKFKRIV